jgi:hypothetical protein
MKNPLAAHQFDKFRSLINGRKSIHDQQECVGDNDNNDVNLLKKKTDVLFSESNETTL